MIDEKDRVAGEITAEKNALSSQGKPPHGFSKGVNDYLNYYVTVSDAKAAVLIALDFAVLQFLLKNHFEPIGDVPLHFLALSFLSLSVLISAFVLFPRLPKGSSGVIFWEDVLEMQSPQNYELKLMTIDESLVEREYSHQNFYISSVVHRKMRLMQLAIVLFAFGFAATLVSAIC